MEIGEFIALNRDALESWGKHVVAGVKEVAGSLLKVPPGHRVKEVASARVKQITKGYMDPVTQMTDLVGARFVVLTTSDLAPICSFLVGQTDWHVIQVRDPQEEIARSPTVFGYQSNHFEVRSKTDQVLDGVVVPMGMCCEVQVRTLLQHAYAELTHDKIYKPEDLVPSQAERLVARSMALMETTDELLCRAVEEVNRANAPKYALKMAAKEAVPSATDRAGEALIDVLIDGFHEEITGASAADFRAFVGRNRILLQTISDRADSNIFAFPDAALVAYWFIQKLGRRAFYEWPLPGSVDSAHLMASDLGISVPR